MRAALITIAAVALAACADVCSQAAAASNAVANKFASCLAADPSFFGGFSPCFDAQACDTNLASCSSGDRSVLDATIACQNSYAGNADCSNTGVTNYDDCAFAATHGADGGSALSPACAAQFAQNQGSCAAGAGQ